MRFLSPVLSLTVLAALSVAVSGVAHAQGNNFAGVLSGANQVPVNASTATGSVTVNILSATSLTVNLAFTGLTGGPASAGHIHQGAPGLNGSVIIPFTGFPAATSGTYTNTFTDTGDGVIAGVISDLRNQVKPYYVNVHNSTFPGGEIRANLVAVPEAGTGLLLALAGSSALGAVVVRRRRPTMS